MSDATSGEWAGRQSPIAEGDVVRVLVVEDNDIDAFIVGEMLARARGVHAAVERAVRLDDALTRLEAGDVDLVLLDLTLPDSRGLDTFGALSLAHPEVPAIVFTASDDESLAISAVRQGAQDYLVKGQVTAEALGRAIRYALERHRLMDALRSLSLIDDLTGLYNRRGFLTLAESHLQLARRGKRRAVLVFGDLDGLKQVNDSHGHHSGDLALRAAAQVLRASFRQSDLIARLGGDEFAVLAHESAESHDAVLLRRLEEQFAAWNAQSSLPFRVGMSVGLVGFQPDRDGALEEALARADEALYRQKRARRAASAG